ncbi:MAG: carbamoyl-phosphate synthase large subunit [Acutalibacteraceae bacterium]|nr:carbamoyl-phosphate synthase large subunit [Acutalibacteraceae bacterium]
MPLNKDIKKVLVIGSGPIVIGQAAEFDYAGAQACRVLKDAGLDVVLVNSNPATIMTDSALANEIYLEPLTVETVKRIIEKERPDSILAGLGGQTGLTIAMQLAKDGYLEKMGVKLLGTNAEAIDKAEDRQMFRDTMLKIGQPCIPSDIATTVDRAAEIAEEIGYPVILRPAFTLGGAGGGVAYNEQELRVITYNGLMLSPITQVLVEKYIAGWKEIEFEVMRDSAGNAIAICSMENIDPVGVHTGDSIVVAPAMTLSDKEYQMLRSASLDIITELGIEGGCNCQFALDPESFEYAVIEVNPRVSRSSALASKATGFPIAKVTSKIALGYTLDEIRNDITGKTCACFEPTVDYCVVKFPKWPFDKFVSTSRKLGTQMKATGEVMAIAPSFEMAIMKAVRGAEIGLDTLNYNKFPENMDVIEKLHDQDDIRLFTVFKALKEGVSIEEIHSITMIDEWFLAKLKNLADYEKMLTSGDLDEDYYIKGKKLGYKDSTIQKLAGKLPEKTLDAVYKMVDTCGAEFKAETPYFYSTYDTECESREIKRGEKETIIVLGSGPIRIGQGIEFDYSSVHCVWTLKELGYEVVIINNNPETVSTDFDTADRLYFEPLNDEDVMNVIKVENPVGVVVAFGGQTAIKLTKFLDESGIKILGTSAEGIDIAEDRERFDALLESFNIKRPQGLTVMNVDEALKAADELGYPVLLRPSYVIGGQNMTIAYNETDVRIYMDIILAQKIENPVLVDQYLMGDELEVDVISDGKDVLIPGVMEHIERAGVHSGDSIAVYPPYNIPDKMLDKVIECSTNLALALGTKGLVNIQYLIFRNELYVIEVNPRASRTIPYISKVTGVPMVELATKVMTGTPLKELGYGTGLYKIPPYFAIKVPVFSFEKLSDINSELGPEMKSTGEVLGIGRTLNEALFKGLVSAGFKVGLQSTYHDKKYNAGVLISVHDKDKPEIVGIAKKFADLGLKIYSTAKTGVGLRAAGIEVETIGDFNDCSAVLDVLETGKIDYIVYTGSTKQATIQNFIKIHRRAVQLSICTLTSLDTANALCDTLASRFTQRNTELVDINNLREEKMQLKFTKMQATGNDDIYFNNFCNIIPSPESLTVNFTDRHFGIGADGVVLLESSKIADAKMVVYNNDGTQTRMAVNSIRCAAKYLYDNGIVPKKNMTIETSSGVMKVKLYTFNGEVRSATVDIGKPDFAPASIPMSIDAENAIGYETEICGEKLTLNCVSVGNPHCIVFRDDIDSVDINEFGDMIRNSELLPEYINTGVARLIDKNTIKLRCYERAVNGESLSCGASAAACVVVATELGMCKKGEDITVKMPGGDLVITYTDETILVNGDTQKVYEGVVEY